MNLSLFLRFVELFGACKRDLGLRFIDLREEMEVYIYERMMGRGQIRTCESSYVHMDDPVKL